MSTPIREHPWVEWFKDKVRAECRHYWVPIHRKPTLTYQGTPIYLERPLAKCQWCGKSY